MDLTTGQKDKLGLQVNLEMEKTKNQATIGEQLTEELNVLKTRASELTSEVEQLRKNEQQLYELQNKAAMLSSEIERRDKKYQNKL